jgi:hypothetical protein
MSPPTCTAAVYLDGYRYPIEQIQPIRFLHEMLPYDPNTRKHKQLQIGLNEYQMLLRASLEAIDHYSARRLERFDSLVGENACQIRAVQLALILKHNRVDTRLLQIQINQALADIDLLLEQKTIQSIMQESSSLQDVLIRENLIIGLKEEERFLILNFLLAEAKDSPQTIDLVVRRQATPKHLKRFGIVSSNFVEHLVNRLRKHLSIDSVKFVRNMSQKQSNELMVSDAFTLRHINCACIPMFWTYKTLLQTLEDENISILLHAKFIKVDKQGEYVIDREICLNYNEGQFTEITAAPIDLQSPAVVFHGAALVNDDYSIKNWLQSLNNYSINDIILACAADHRQYPNPELDSAIILLENSEYNHFKKLAQANGFALQNPTTFFIHHVFTELPKKIAENYCCCL